MADQNEVNKTKEKIRQALEKLGEALNEWLNGKQLRPQPIPIPIERRPYRRK